MPKLVDGTGDLREIETNTQNVVCFFEDPDSNGDNNEYLIWNSSLPVQSINFRSACNEEDLLAIVKNRLEHSQIGPFPCEENKKALQKIGEAIVWLNQRIVEGTDNA